MASTGSLYNHSRITRQMLRRHRRSPASFYLHLHPAWIRFEDAKGRLILEEPITAPVAGPSRLAGQDGGLTLTPGKELLRCIRDQQLPNYMLDLLDARRIPFYEGCLIVEIKDHRQGPAPGQSGTVEQSGAGPAVDPKSLAARLEGGHYGEGPAFLAAKKARQDAAGGSAAATSTLSRGPETYRVVLHPTEETLWTELRTLNDKLSGGTWSEEEGLEIESKILNLTSPPLCLTPDPHATRIANVMLATTAPPSRYAPVRPMPHQKTLPPLEPRKATTISESADDEEAQRELAEKAKREAVMRMMTGSWRMYAKDKKNTARTAQAQLPNSAAGGERPFTPTFSRLTFIEKYRAKANGAAQSEAEVGERTQDSGATNRGEPSASGAAGKKASAATSKKRKKQEESATPGAEDAAPAPKGKKKKTTAAASATATTPAAASPEPKGKGAKADSPKPAAAAKGKAAPKKKGTKKGTADDATSDAAPTPAAESTADTSVGGKAGKKAPTPAKKTPAKGKKAQQQQQQQQQQQANSRQSTATPALHAAQLPASSPPRHGVNAASPFAAGAGIATPSPAMSHAAPSNGGGNFAPNLPFGVPQHHQQHQQQQAAAAAQLAAHFNLPLGVGMPPGMVGQTQGQQGQQPGGGMGLPFATPPQQAQGGGQQMGNMMGGGGAAMNQLAALMGSQMANNNNNNVNAGGVGGASFGGLAGNNAHTAAQVAQQLQQHPNFSQLPPAVQHQVMQWQQRQQQQGQGGGQGGGGAQGGGGGGMLPPGWPMAQR
ncbi:hypothetical protein BDZ90DRAFT_229331 [Jaminaea rosea]|uniref:Spt20-like SEP domain-containing protein n=1 Tax=Jaminaea rosea TaxID=1569628 RepID=A0A316UZ97_9BASI|nr:hypothetical protein BDZ90DRAFT_229331 [Jaminaea rosea]PWN30314.1 hypothetical protein BDZ90DRAFT_229331 [Jaminaea rosea]